MGMPILGEADIDRLPFAMTGFSSIRNSGCLYADKTAKIRLLARIKGAPVFLSRPRRFGKSLLVSTFESLFSRGLQDFKGLAIETGKEKWTDKTYKTVRLDFSQYANFSCEELSKRFALDLADSFEDTGKNPATDEHGNYYPPEYILRRGIRNLPDKSVVLLIDEYDSPITHHIHDVSERDKIIAVLSGFFATIKSYEPKFRFVFITGITRIAHVSLFSVFNTLKDITCDDDYATLLGITDAELHHYFDPYVRNAAAVLDMSVSDVYEKLKTVYDGFQFSIDAAETVYNPWSVLSFLRDPKKGFLNYWYATSGGTPTILVKYLEDKSNLELFSKLNYQVKNAEDGENLVSLDTLMSKSDPDKIPMAMLLTQTGYFTLRKDSSEYARLVIPNDEVAESLIKLSLDINHLNPAVTTRSKLAKLAALVNAGDIEGIFSLFNTALTEGISANAKAFNDENSIRDFIYVLLPRNGIIKTRENPNARGFSDLEIRTNEVKLVIEFKRIHNGYPLKTAMKDALDQLKSRHYGETVQNLRLIRAAMVISPEDRNLADFRVLEEVADI